MLDAICSVYFTLYSLISDTVVLSFNLSYFVGQLIVWSLLTIYSALKNVLFTIRIFLQVLAEDSHFFLLDVASKFSFIGESLLTCTEAAGQNVKTLLGTLFSGIESVHSLFLNVLHSINCSVLFIFNSIKVVCVLFRDSIILVGSTSWSVFMFIPQQIAHFKQTVVSLTLFFMKEIRHITLSVQILLYKTYYEVLSFITDVPRESIYGLCLSVLLCCVLLKYWQNIYPSSVRYVGVLMYQSRRTLLIAWNCLETFTLWLLTNQTTAAFPNVNIDTNAGGENATQRGDLHENDCNRLERSVESKQFGHVLHDQEDRLCVVCQDEERSTIILPCRHVCLCHDCCVTIKRTHGRCPVCRHVVRRTMRVYI